ncbi:MAG TPA: uroporphyrinogen-III synthase [Candidatus Acidoferrum sp.]|nr:uroporphyrinogen-III synthase [Candidatus Acidoferrum sp.]
MDSIHGAAESVISALSGKRVVITRAARQSVELVENLGKLGALPILLPLVAFSAPEDFAPLDAALDRLEQFDWIIFTSENAVRAVVKRASVRGNQRNVAGRRSRAAAVGPTTAAAAERAGFFVDYQAKTHSGAALANELGEKLQGQSIFLPRSDRANPDLPQLLKKYGAEITEVIAYRTVTPVNLDQDKIAAIANADVDAILFFSPTAVEHFVGVVGKEKVRDLQNRLALTAVGPITANALRQSGVDNLLVADDTTSDAVIAVLQKHFATTPKISAVGAVQK